MNKLYMFLSAAALALCACGNDDPDVPGNGGNNNGDNNNGGNASVTDVPQVTSGLIADMTADKACYKPGEPVKLTIATLPADAKVRYRQGAKVIKEEPLTSTEWTWNPPATDFTGYMVDVYTVDGIREKIHGSIAVDVSSDWTRFPRYGFVATFDGSKLPSGVIEEEMAFLSRCHINGVQFQDWHNKHHWPLGGTRDKLDDVYKDIANRDVYTSVVKKYIDVQHSLGMKSIFYNLCFGALKDAKADGVKEEWYIFKNPGHGEKDFHGPLPSSWKSDIWLLDPGNPEWQAYIAERNDEVYSNIAFDGYQIDQLGDRGTRYDYDGNKVNLPKAYGSFIDAMKKRHPDKRLIMNSVSCYGAAQIAGSGKVDFCYNEVWDNMDGEGTYEHLYDIIRANDQYSGHTLRTVFAAYMNRDKGSGSFNTPGVVLTDAVMMALGGSHLELGDHMLCNEYFPNSSLSMPDDLRTAMIRYYDFMTAYQNLLRGESTQAQFTPALTLNSASSRVNLKAWPPAKGTVTTFGKNVDGAQVIHFLNFINVDDLSWRDLKGTRRAPQLVRDLEITVDAGKKVTKVWCASPDQHGGVPQLLGFAQKNNKVTITIPQLRYWTMLVIE